MLWLMILVIEWMNESGVGHSIDDGDCMSNESDIDSTIENIWTMTDIHHAGSVNQRSLCTS